MSQVHQRKVRLRFWLAMVDGKAGSVVLGTALGCWLRSLVLSRRSLREIERNCFEPELLIKHDAFGKLEYLTLKVTVCL